MTKLEGENKAVIHDVFARKSKTVNSLADDGIEPLAATLLPGETIALLGSSGAGKSTLLNSLYGEQRQKTGGVRDGDERGKHTTTHRELVLLPNGALIIDTPGMRELQLWEGSDSMGAAFHDVDELAAGCRYSDSAGMSGSRAAPCEQHLPTAR